jgi:uncharacterized membrane protein
MNDTRLNMRSTMNQFTLLIPLFIVTLTKFLPSNAILGLASMLVICTFPGYALLNRFKLHRSSRFQDLFFSVLLSLLLLQIVYTAYSVFCYGIGFESSLTKTQVFLITIIILLISSYSLRKEMQSSLSTDFVFDFLTKLQGINFTIYLIPLSLPLISLIAVTRLNVRNDSVTTAVLLYACIFILLVLCSQFVLAKSVGLHYLIFYCTLLALLIGSTFRGDGGFWGVDINREYTVAMRVLLQEHWIPLSGSPYNSMLSITVLPVVLSFLTKFSLPIVFKLFYVLIGALIPLASYCLLRRFARNSIAMGVVIIQIVGSISYIPQMTALARQSIGSAFFIGMLLVVLDPVWDRRIRTKVILLFACGLSFSHYSSAYLCSVIFVSAGFFSFFVKRSVYFRRTGLKPITTLSLGLAILFITFFWNAALNNSTRDLASVSTNISSQGLRFLPNETGSFIDRWLNGVVVTNKKTPDEFKTSVLKINAFTYPNLQPTPPSLTYEIKQANYAESKPPLGTSTAQIFTWLYILINTAFQAMIAFQVALALLSIFKLISKAKRKTINSLESNIPMVLTELIPLASISLLLALVLRISGTGSQFYNPERAAFQLAFIFSLSIALLLESLVRRSKAFQRACGTALLLSCFVFLQQATGLVGYIYGSPSSRISSGMSADSTYIISRNEQNAADWINRNSPKNSILQSDDAAALVNSQYDIFDKKPLIKQLAPFALFNGSYVYLSKANLETGITRQGGSGLSFKVPLDYLDQNLSAVYSSGGARVYR